VISSHDNQATSTSLRSTFEWWWTGVALLLAPPTGWLLAATLLESPNTGHLVLHATLAPAAVLFGIGVNYALNRWSIRRVYSTPVTITINPTGARTISFYLPDGAETEFRQSLYVTLGQAIIGTILLGPVLATYVNADDTVLRHAAIPGMILGVMLLAQVLPAHPFHGGNLLRSIFWYLHDDARTGTRAAFLYSQIVASGAIGFGIYFFFLGGPHLLYGVWCFYAAILMLTAARSEIGRVNFIVRAGQIRAADAVSGLNPTVRASAPLTEAIDILLEQKQNGPGLVRDRNIYSGAILLDRIRQIPRKEWPDLTTSDAQTPFEKLDDSAPAADLLETLRQLQRSDSGIVIVYEQNGEIAGLIDATMSPRMLLRRGLSRDPNQLIDHQRGQKGQKTS
jgi:hypothetical protein